MRKLLNKKLLRGGQGAPWHGEPIRPSGLSKASLTESDRWKMQQCVGCNSIHGNLPAKGVSKPSLPGQGVKAYEIISFPRG